MRKLIYFWLIMLAALHATAQTRGISYQAVARNASGTLLSNQTINLTLRIRETSAAGTLVYEETHSPITNDYGLFTVVIGNGTVVSGSFDGIAWADDLHFLEVLLNSASVGTQELVAVPYAKVATDMLLKHLTDVDDTAPASGQVLKWSGSQWVPAADAGIIYSAGAGIGIAGNIISNTGDADATNDITNTTTAGGDLTGTYPNPNVGGLQGISVAATAPVSGQVLKYNGTSWAPGTDLVSGGGGGAVNVTARLTGDGTAGAPLDLASQGASSGQVLKFNGSSWAPATDNTTTYTAGSGIVIAGTTISATDASATNELQTLSLSGASLTLSNGGGTVTLPTGTTYTAGTGINIAGNVITNTGDTDAANDITNTTTAGGDLTGTYPNPNVDGLQGIAVSATAPSNGQALVYNGTQWTPTTLPAGTVYSAGTGISIAGNVITNTGDLSNTNELQTLSLSGASLTLSNGGGTVTLPTGTTYTAGTGISLASNIITNTGDTDAANDITNTTTAGGDLAGTYPNPTVDGLQGVGVATTTPTNGQVLKYNGTAWAPAGDNNTTYTAGTGLSLTGTVFANTGDTDAANDITNTTTAGGDLAGTYPNPTVDGLQGVGVATTAPTNGQVLKYNGTAWAPAGDNNTTYTAGTGLSLTGTVFANTGDTDAANDITNTTTAGGDLAGTYPNPNVDGLQGVAVSATAPSNGQALVYNGIQWTPTTLPAGTVYSAGTGISIAGNVITNTGDTDASNDITNTTAAGGDLTGTYPNPTVDGLRGVTVSATAPSSGQALIYNGTQWAPAAIPADGDGSSTNELQTLSIANTTISLTSGGSVVLPYTAGTGITVSAAGIITNTGDLSTTNELQTLSIAGQNLTLSNGGGTVALPTGTTYTAGTGLSLTGTVFANTGDTDASNDITNTTTAGGDLTGIYPNPNVDGLQGVAVSATTPSNGQVLKYNGTAWAPAGDNNTTYTAGAGLSLTGTVFANTGDTDAANDITNTTAAGGDLTGTYPNPTVDALQGTAVANTVPSNGQVLKFNGTSWAPAGDNNTTYTAGTGITIAGTTISAVDASATNELQTLSIAGQNLTLSNGGGTVALPTGTTYTAGTGLSLTGTVFANTGDTDASNDITNTTTAGGDLTGTYPNPTVDGLQGVDVATTAPTNGQVLKYNGTAWAPAGDNNTTYTAGTGLSLTGTVFANTGDTDASNDITNTTAAGGDLTGTYPNPTVDGLRGVTVSATAPTNGQALIYNGTQWAPAAIPADGDGSSTNEIQTLSIANTTISLSNGGGSVVLPYTAGTGITVSATGVIANTGDTNAANDITNTTTAGGDLTGTYPNPTVDGLQGRPVSATVPVTNQILRYDGTQWIPSNETTGSGPWVESGSNIYWISTSPLGGNVGIGDATPAASLTVGNGDKFQVSGTDGDVIFTDDNATIRFPATAIPNSPMIQMFASGTQNADRMVVSHSPSFPAWGIEYKDTTDVLYFRDGSARRFAFELSSGYMGIGVENPDFPLDALGRMRLRSTGNLSNSPGIWFQNNAGTFDRAFFGMSEPDSIVGIYSQHMGKWAIEFEVMREPRIGINIPAGSPPRAELHLYHTNFGGSNDGVRIQNEGSNAHYWNLYTSNTTGDFEFFKQGIKRATIN
ncbi:MAG: hypothetical protein SF053_16650, partial [Bacteroidia bacterium]|nr:hypothetical protein [Bacteroidia bacterium]